MSKDQLDLVDETKAQVDFLAYTSFFLLLYGPLHIFVFAVVGKYLVASLGVLGFVGAYTLYRASLKGLRGYLDMFKSVFDVLRESLRKKVEMSVTGLEPVQHYWDDVWRVLQYGRSPKTNRIMVMIALSQKDPVNMADELTKAGLILNASRVQGDYEIMGSLAASNLVDALAKVEVIRKRPDVRSVAYVIAGELESKTTVK